jgi:hypothetical protein
LLDRLRDKPGQTLGDLATGFAQSRQALSKHLATLESVGLVATLWRGREKLHYLNPLPLQALPARWITTTARETTAALAALKQALEPASATTRILTRGVRDPVAAALALAPAAMLDGARIADVQALTEARHYLAGSADAVRRLIDALPPNGGYDKPADGGFSLAEHVWHLADIEELGWRPRFERLLAESRPRLADVDGDRLAVERRYQAQPWRGAARRFVAQRRRTLQALSRFDASTLDRPAWFGGRRCSAGDVLAAAVAHDREHRREMAARWSEHLQQSVTAR